MAARREEPPPDPALAFVGQDAPVREGRADLGDQDADLERRNDRDLPLLDLVDDGRNEVAPFAQHDVQGALLAGLGQELTLLEVLAGLADHDQHFVGADVIEHAVPGGHDGNQDDDDQDRDRDQGLLDLLEAGGADHSPPPFVVLAFVELGRVESTRSSKSLPKVPSGLANTDPIAGATFCANT